jgi:hypothetical protein
MQIMNNELHKLLESFFVKKDSNIGNLLWHGISTVREEINSAIRNNKVRDELYSLLRTFLKLYLQVHVLKKTISYNDLIVVKNVIKEYKTLVGIRTSNEGLH